MAGKGSLMRRAIVALAVACVMTLAPNAFASQVCGGAEELESVSFSGAVSAGEPYVRPLGDGMTFVLAPSAHGWRIDVFGPGGANFAEITPPLHMAESNPRALSGWHFRNAANTGPNAGDVNAPQHFRTFVFGAGALDEELRAGVEALVGAPDFGRGEFEITSMELADLGAGQRARFETMQFQACLEWRMVADAPVEQGEGPFPAQLVAAFDACGLPETVRLSPHMSQGAYPAANYLEPDLDGDGVHEIVAPIVRMQGGKRGLAVCWRDGSRLDVLGLDGDLGAHLTPAYFDRMDYWHVHMADEVSQGVGENAPPVLNGQGVILGIEGASSVLIYLSGGAFTSYWQGD